MKGYYNKIALFIIFILLFNFVFLFSINERVRAFDLNEILGREQNGTIFTVIKGVVLFWIIRLITNNNEETPLQQ